MKRFISVLGVLALQMGAVQSAETPAANLQLIMLTQVNAQGLALWDITNNAVADSGDLDPKLITADKWAKLLEIGKALEQGGKTLATSSKIIAAAKGSKLQDEGNQGASTAADVQRYLDAKPAEFRKHAVALQKTGADVIQAATKRDTKKLNEVAGNLDAVCEDCHVVFWYPQQRK